MPVFRPSSASSSSTFGRVSSPSTRLVFKEGIEAISAYVVRSLNYITNSTTRALTGNSLSPSAPTATTMELPMLTCNTRQQLNDGWIVGCDADLGGESEAFWGLTEQGSGLFYGNVSTHVPKHIQNTIKQTGYAGIRSKARPFTLLHRPVWDTTIYRYLAVRAKGDTRQWFVNLQTASSLYPTFLYQHKLIFQNPGKWETVLIPFQDFILTSQGFIQKRQIEMDRTQVSTVGFSIVRQDGPFALELDWIKAVNTENTFGDFDVLRPGEVWDPRTGEVRLLRKGEDARDVYGTRIRLFEDNDKLSSSSIRRRKNDDDQDTKKL